jgi:hypothetical protein
MECLKRVRKRAGRCYELAGRVMLYEPGADGFTLVHGHLCPQVKVDPHRAYAHAWIELPNGTIYDPVLDQYIPVAVYAASWGAVAEARYTQKKAVTLMTGRGDFGPWHA